MKNKKIHMSVL